MDVKELIGLVDQTEKELQAEADRRSREYLENQRAEFRAALETNRSLYGFGAAEFGPLGEAFLVEAAERETSNPAMDGIGHNLLSLAPQCRFYVRTYSAAVVSEYRAAIKNRPTPHEIERAQSCADSGLSVEINDVRYRLADYARAREHAERYGLDELFASLGATAHEDAGEALATKPPAAKTRMPSLSGADWLVLAAPFAFIAVAALVG